MTQSLGAACQRQRGTKHNWSVNGYTEIKGTLVSHTHKRLCSVIYLESSHRIYKVYRVQRCEFFFGLRQGTYRIQYYPQGTRCNRPYLLLASIRSCIHNILMKKKWGHCPAKGVCKFTGGDETQELVYKLASFEPLQ